MKKEPVYSASTPSRHRELLSQELTSPRLLIGETSSQKYLFDLGKALPSLYADILTLTTKYRASQFQCVYQCINLNITSNNSQRHKEIFSKYCKIVTSL